MHTTHTHATPSPRTHGTPGTTPTTPRQHAKHHTKTAHTARRFLAGLAAIALAATGAIATTPGTAQADSHRDSQWYLNDFNIDKVHDLSQGEGVKIGVIDSGIDANHPDLKDNIEAGKTYGTATDKGLSDTKDHGTSTTSLMVGHGHGDNNTDGILGIAPKAKVISVGIDWKDASDPVNDWMIDAIEWLTKKDVNIIVVGIASPYIPRTDAIEKANNAGIAVVSAAGNKHFEQPWGDTDERVNTMWPANAKGAIPVTGTNQNHKFWDDGLTLNAAAKQPQLGLSAPATKLPVAQPGGGYTTRTGTSGAAPIVAGTLALIKSAYPNLPYYDMNERLLGTVDDKGPEGFDDKYGWGIINPHKALTAETTFTDADGNDTVSSPDDRLPLAEQGDPVDNHPPDGQTDDPGAPESTQDEAAETDPTGPPAWLTVAIITAGVLLIAALITVVLVKTRRGKKNHNPQAVGQQPGPPPPNTGQAPGTPPVQPPPGNQPTGNPAAPQQTPGTPPTQPPAPGTPWQPPAPGQTPPPASGSPWQPPNPDTNPPPQ